MSMLTEAAAIKRSWVKMWEWERKQLRDIEEEHSLGHEIRGRRVERLVMLGVKEPGVD